MNEKEYSTTIKITDKKQVEKFKKLLTPPWFTEREYPIPKEHEKHVKLRWESDGKWVKIWNKDLIWVP